MMARHPLGGLHTSGGRPPSEWSVRHDALCAEHGRARGATMVLHLGGATAHSWAYVTRLPTRRPRGVRFHPGALRCDVVSPLYDLLTRPGGAREERMRSGVTWWTNPTSQNLDRNARGGARWLKTIVSAASAATATTSCRVGQSSRERLNRSPPIVRPRRCRRTSRRLSVMRRTRRTNA